MSDYGLTLPRRVYCGSGAIGRLEAVASGHPRVAVFTDRGVAGSGALELPMAALERAGAKITVLDDLPAEPTCDQAQAVVDRFGQTGATLIVAIGGGSVMDVAKLASIAGGSVSVRSLVDNPFLGKKTVETVMIPTTAGTGSEATANSIVAVPEKQVKIGIVNAGMLADHVILDGAMTRNLPRHIAASTGIDALCHAVECYTSLKATPFSNLFALEAVRLIFANLDRACEGSSAEAEKTAMLLAAFYGGAAIAASGTTAVHALSYPLGGKYHIPHGVANAMLLLPVLRFNRPACETELAGIHDALRGPERADATIKSQWVLDQIQSLLDRLGLPPAPAAYGIAMGDLDGLVAAGMEQQRLLGNNKRTVTAGDAREIYRQLLE